MYNAIVKYTRKYVTWRKIGFRQLIYPSPVLFARISVTGPVHARSLREMQNFHVELIDIGCTDATLERRPRTNVGIDVVEIRNAIRDEHFATLCWRQKLPDTRVLPGFDGLSLPQRTSS